MSARLSEFSVVLGALELGIVPPLQSVDEALKSMTPSEQIKCKRKYRKLVRQLKRRHRGTVDWPKSWMRREVIRECGRAGERVIESE